MMMMMMMLNHFESSSPYCSRILLRSASTPCKDKCPKWRIPGWVYKPFLFNTPVCFSMLNSNVARASQSKSICAVRTSPKCSLRSTHGTGLGHVMNGIVSTSNQSNLVRLNREIVDWWSSMIGLNRMRSDSRSDSEIHLAQVSIFHSLKKQKRR